MKLIVITLACCFSANLLFSQSLLPQTPNLHGVPKVDGASVLSQGNTLKSASGVMAKLGPTLALSGTQKEKVTAIVAGFIKNKAALSPLQQTDKPVYASKLSALQGGLSSKLKTVLTVAQYSKFLGLKPATPSPTSLLSTLFY